VLSNEIILEYEEVAAREIGAAYAVRIGLFIQLVGQTRGSIHLISPNFRFQTTQADLDGNKFAGCPICVNGDYVITLDRHFQQMKGCGHLPQPITPDEFIGRHLPKKQES
jgi:hypothetical protein